MSEPYEREGRIVIPDPYVSQFGTEVPMCTVDDMIGGEPCLRVAQWEWQPEGTHPVFLCNFHADPLLPSSAFTPVNTATIPKRQGTAGG